MSLQNKNLEGALADVRSIIENVVREEQLMDKLTGLPNDMALNEELDECTRRGNQFWAAFIEVDQFKRINDEFGYQSADLFLVKVAEHLVRASSDFFVGASKAFRAHGDEFYIVGELERDTAPEIEDRLEKLRLGIDGIRVPVDGKTKPIMCSVSIGWATSEDVTEDRVTSRGVRLVLENAVSFAKRKGRNCVVRYLAEMQKQSIWTIRDNCSCCRSAFTVDVPLENAKDSHLLCPNCGEYILRPDRPGSPPAVREI